MKYSQGARVKFTSPAHMREVLKDYIVNMTFIKSNGDLREVYGTTVASVVAGKTAGSGTESSLSENSNLIKIFDVELDEWRSFRYDRLSPYSKNVIVG